MRWYVLARDSVSIRGIVLVFADVLLCEGMCGVLMVCWYLLLNNGVLAFASGCRLCCRADGGVSWRVLVCL